MKISTSDLWVYLQRGDTLFVSEVFTDKLKAEAEADQANLSLIELRVKAPWFNPGHYEVMTLADAIVEVQDYGKAQGEENDRR